MKKKTMIGMLSGAFFLVILILWLVFRTTGILKDVNISDISKIMIYNPDGITITEMDDIKSVVDILQSMKLRRTFFDDRDGGLVIDLYYKNGDTSWVTLYSDCVGADGDYYACDRDYCEDISELYKKLSEK